MTLPGFNVTSLTEGTAPRVWSYLVTIFGDLTRDDAHAQLSGALLTRMSEAAGIRPEATRVALHRLRKEGWITSTRTGRTSRYALTLSGRARSIAAAPAIYGPFPTTGTVFLTLAESEPHQPDPERIMLSPELAISRHPPADPALLTATLSADHPVPAWIHDRILSADLTALAQDTEAAFQRVRELGLPGGDLCTVDHAVWRTLIVHLWRRVALRLPDLPDAFFPQDWPGLTCRASFLAFDHALPRPDLSALDPAGNPLGSAPNAARKRATS